MFKYGPEELGAPTAAKKDSLFDWQMENDGARSVERFGRVEGLLKCFGTDPKVVRAWMSELTCRV